MKKIKDRIQYLFILMAVVCLFSCSSDDDDTTPAGYAWSGIGGSYTGWTSATFAYSPDPMVADGEKMNVTVNEDGTADVALQSSQWGDMTIASAVVKDENGVFTLSGTGKAVLGMAGREPKEYDCLLSGTIGHDRKTCNVVFTLPAVMGGLNITFADGSAPAAE